MVLLIPKYLKIQHNITSKFKCHLLTLSIEPRHLKGIQIHVIHHTLYSDVNTHEAAIQIREL